MAPFLSASEKTENARHRAAAFARQQKNYIEITSQLPRPRRISPKKAPSVGRKFAVVIIVVVGITLLHATMMYYGGATSLYARYSTKVLPYPIALVNGKIIWYHQWQKTTDQLATTNTDATSVQSTNQQALDRLINQKLINQLAKKYKIVIGDDEVQKQLATITDSIGGPSELERYVKNTYGLSVTDFTNDVLKSTIIKNKVAMAIMLDDRINQPSRLKAEMLLRQVLSQPQIFAQLARLNSEDITAVQGGDLGYIGHGQMSPEFEAAAFTLGKGQISNIVTTPFGYHIIMIEEQLHDAAGQVTQVRARQILIRGQDIDSYIEQLKKQATVWQFIRL